MKWNLLKHQFFWIFLFCALNPIFREQVVWASDPKEVELQLCGSSMSPRLEGEETPRPQETQQLATQDLLTQDMSSIQSLHFSGCQESHVLQSIALRALNLKNLNLDQVGMKKIQSTQVLILKNPIRFQNLEHLTLRNSQSLKRVWIEAPQLKVLSIRNCPNLDFQTLAQFCTQCPMLESLELDGSGAMTPEDLYQLGSNLAKGLDNCPSKPKIAVSLYLVAIQRGFSEAVGDLLALYREKTNELDMSVLARFAEGQVSLPGDLHYKLALLLQQSSEDVQTALGHAFQGTILGDHESRSLFVELSKQAPEQGIQLSTDAVVRDFGNLLILADLYSVTDFQKIIDSGFEMNPNIKDYEKYAGPQAKINQLCRTIERTVRSPAEYPKRNQLLILWNCYQRKIYDNAEDLWRWTNQTLDAMDEPIFALFLGQKCLEEKEETAVALKWFLQAAQQGNEEGHSQVLRLLADYQPAPEDLETLLSQARNEDLLIPELYLWATSHGSARALYKCLSLLHTDPPVLDGSVLFECVKGMNPHTIDEECAFATAEFYEPRELLLEALDYYELANRRGAHRARQSLQRVIHKLGKPEADLYVEIAQRYEKGQRRQDIARAAHLFRLAKRADLLNLLGCRYFAWFDLSDASPPPFGVLPEDTYRYKTSMSNYFYTKDGTRYSYKEWWDMNEQDLELRLNCFLWAAELEETNPWYTYNLSRCYAGHRLLTGEWGQPSQEEWKRHGFWLETSADLGFQVAQKQLLLKYYLKRKFNKALEKIEEYREKSYPVTELEDFLYDRLSICRDGTSMSFEGSVNDWSENTHITILNKAERITFLRLVSSTPPHGEVFVDLPRVLEQYGRERLIDILQSLQIIAPKIEVLELSSWAIHGDEISLEKFLNLEVLELDWFQQMTPKGLSHVLGQLQALQLKKLTLSHIEDFEKDHYNLLATLKVETLEMWGKGFSDDIELRKLLKRTQSIREVRYGISKNHQDVKVLQNTRYQQPTSGKEMLFPDSIQEEPPRSLLLNIVDMP